jgi:hypothetical protein
MAITAAQVKELRDRTNAGMMDCKKALAETNGDMEAAVDWLRTKGLAASALPSPEPRARLSKSIRKPTSLPRTTPSRISSAKFPALRCRPMATSKS